MPAFTLRFEEPAATQLALVGGKNASLARMTQDLVGAGIAVPPGFAVTADAYRTFIAQNNMEALIGTEMSALAANKKSLHAAGSAIRAAILAAPLPVDVERDVRAAYAALAKRLSTSDLRVAVRSSATAEDLPEASFAGQQESFLNIRGGDDVVMAYRQCLASLFTDRAIAYRDENGFAHLKVALSVGVQALVRSDLASSGVMFTIDTETGFPDVVVINGAWGLGENVVKGAVNPDEIVLFKRFLGDATKRPVLRTRIGEKEHTMVLADAALGANALTTKNLDTPLEKRRQLCLTIDEALKLARWAKIIEDRAIEKNDGRPTPMDIEWAKDGETGALFIVQARPETVESRKTSGLVTYQRTADGPVLARGTSVGSAIASGRACIIKSAEELDSFPDGAILVAEATDPDWVPVMRKASAIITEHGGRTCHAAIVSRELGIPAVVGARNARGLITANAPITVSCAEGEEGIVFDGTVPFVREEVDLAEIPSTKTKVMINLADPGAALSWWRLPTDGVGLARIEFIIAEEIRAHPMALCRFAEVVDEKDRALIEAMTRGYPDKRDLFVEKLARGVATIAASQYPRPVIVRMSDFKTNEYAGLVGGKAFEPHEENPMIGFRGASRYADPRYREAFELECKAVVMARNEIGLDNIIVMIPFCRTIKEANGVLEVMKSAGLERGRDGLKVYVMCEIPSNVVLATEFAACFDGFSIGSNDLTQLTLGIDRDSVILAASFDERDPAVTRLIEDVIRRAHRAGRPVGICGQGPSDHPDFAEFLVHAGIDSLSLNPDSFLAIKKRIAAIEKESALGARTIPVQHSA